MLLDGHIHIEEGPVNRDHFQKNLAQAGFAGGIVISISPRCFGTHSRTYSNRERLDNLLAWTGGNPRLYPFYWIDPTEEDAAEQVDLAESLGVRGYKVICCHHYPGDPRAMPIYHKIARAGKPILFHSGILWDGQPSAKYNRPGEFEALLDVDHLRFSLAHISWPWIDENIAVYGKFINACSIRPNLSVEMFIDMTPGTPPIYRQEALTKLFRVGYDVENNLIFGVDSNTVSYNHEYARAWLQRDYAILDGLGVGEPVRNKVYGENLDRFISASADRKHSRLVLGE